MAELREITKLYVVTDTEFYYENIGDIDGGMFEDEWLEKYIEYYGTEKLINKLAHMMRQVLNFEIELKQKSQEEYSQKNISK